MRIQFAPDGAARRALLLFVSAVLPLLFVAGVAARMVAAPGDPSDSSIPPLEGGAPAEPPALAPAQPAGEPQAPAAGDAPAINVWYGQTQRFGHRGDPQKWVNILGNVTSAAPLTGLSYTLNGGPSRSLTVGPDSERLALAGDFNIELDYTDLRPGANQVAITATDNAGGARTAHVTVNYQGGAVTWSPGTYVYDWAGASRIDDVGQVVDGQWALQGGGVRPTVLDFDRLIALGDLSWRDYTVTVPVTFFGIDESGYLAPSNGPGVGIMVRWAGHYDDGDGKQPLTGWRRLGALAWYRWQRQGNVYTEGIQMLGHLGRELGSSSRTLKFNTTYYFKLQIQSGSNPATPSTYRFKVWEANRAEPAEWEIERRGVPGEPTGGSVLLLAHHVDARFGAARVDLASTRPRPSLTARYAGQGQGQVATQPPGPTFRFGEDVLVSAAPALGSRFAGWSGALSGADNPGVVTLFESSVITATFNPGGHGVVVPLILK